MRLKTAKENLKTKIFGTNAMSTNTVPETTLQTRAVEGTDIIFLIVPVFQIQQHALRSGANG
jgi:hypothetical protein